MDNEDEFSSGEEESSDENNDSMEDDDCSKDDDDCSKDDDDDCSKDDDDDCSKDDDDDCSKNEDESETDQCDQEDEGKEAEENLYNLDDSDDSIEKCPICLNGFMGQNIATPETCEHMFCLECIEEWSKNMNSCPIDRLEFSSLFQLEIRTGVVVKVIPVAAVRLNDDFENNDVTLCEVCRSGDREDRLLLCDSCDLGYHCECLDPPLETIPIEEWFCPVCEPRNASAARNQGGNIHNRVIARTQASEAVRTRIHRRRIEEYAEIENSEANTYILPRPRQRTVTRRKRKTKRTPAKRKRRTKRKVGTKKRKITKGTKKRKLKRKTKRRFKKKPFLRSRRSIAASTPLGIPSVKHRIAEKLRLDKPLPGHTFPSIKAANASRTFRKLPVDLTNTFTIFGDKDELIFFQDNDPCTASTSTKSTEISRTCQPSTSRDILGDILQNQTTLHTQMKDITILKNGALILKENSEEIQNGKLHKEKSSVDAFKQVNSLFPLKNDEIENELATTVIHHVKSEVCFTEKKEVVSFDKVQEPTESIKSSSFNLISAPKISNCNLENKRKNNEFGNFCKKIKIEEALIHEEKTYKKNVANCEKKLEFVDSLPCKNIERKSLALNFKSFECISSKASNVIQVKSDDTKSYITEKTKNSLQNNHFHCLPSSSNVFPVLSPLNLGDFETKNICAKLNNNLSESTKISKNLTRPVHDDQPKSLTYNLKDNFSNPENLLGNDKTTNLKEQIAHIVKASLKNYYKNQEINKEEYKDILRKCVQKVYQSKSSRIDAQKIDKLVADYVKIAQHRRKKQDS